MATFETYHALLTLTENNMRVIHWKLKGGDFNVTHSRYGMYYEKLGEMMDETAEQMITMGHTPMNISNALMHLGKDIGVDATIMNPELDYNSQIADETTYKMFKELYNFAARLAVDAALPADVQDIFMGHAKWFRIEGLYKLGRSIGIIDKAAVEEANANSAQTEDVEVIPPAENPVIAQDHTAENKPLNEEQPTDADVPYDTDDSDTEPLDDGGEKFDDNESEPSMIEPIGDDM